MTQLQKEVLIEVFTKLLNIINDEFFICDALSEISSWNEFSEEDMEFAHDYLMNNRPTKDKFKKFYLYRHFSKNDDTLGWWAIKRRFRPTVYMPWDIEQEYPRAYQNILKQKDGYIRALLVQIQNEEVEVTTD